MFASRLVVPAVAGAALLTAPAALAAGSISPAHGATRRAIVRAFVVQDGSSAGISAVDVAAGTPMAVVCQRTPDAGLVRYLFDRSGRSWHYAFSTRSTSTGTAVDRRLERACG